MVWYCLAFLCLHPQVEIGHITILGKNQDLIAQIGLADGLSLPYTGSLDIPLIDGIIRIEDKRFFSHHGTDIIAKFSAIRDRILLGSGRGGSTLTEQYAKNIYFPGASRTVFQKIRETLVAQTLEAKETKETLLRKYLDTVYMGNGVYGITLAMQTYFWKTDATQLDPAEIVELITRIHSPNISTSSGAYRKMVSEKLFGHDISPISLVWKNPETVNTDPLLVQKILKEQEKYCHQEKNNFEEFLREIPEGVCKMENLTLHTTIDTRLSDFSRNVLESTITPLLAKNLSNGAIYIRENTTWKILVSIGGRPSNTSTNQIDMTTRRRSVGSVLKPFVYALAMRDGADGESLILDDTRIYDTSDPEKKYVPENYVTKSYGVVTLQEALGNSLNSATVRLSEKLGIGRIADFYGKNDLDLDHESGYYGYGISLGAVELTLENIVHGYARLADLTDPDNFIIAQILKNPANRAKTFGISSILNTSIPISVKTWTSTDFRDNWAIGYTSDITIGVWVGNADGSQMQDVSGVTGAGPIWHRIAEEMIRQGYIKNQELKLPLWISELYICRDRGCNQRQQSYQKNGLTHKSHMIDREYFRSDFVHDLTSEEVEKWRIQ